MSSSNLSNNQDIHVVGNIPVNVCRINLLLKSICVVNILVEIYEDPRRFGQIHQIILAETYDSYQHESTVVPQRVLNAFVTIKVLVIPVNINAAIIDLYCNGGIPSNEALFCS